LKQIQQSGNKIAQLIIVIFAAVLMFNTFYLISIIQTTGRVINYTGVLRGGAQRLVKLELSGKPHDELMEYLDEIIHDLRYGGGKYRLVKLNQEEYLIQLSALSVKWEELKSSILEYRRQGNGPEELLELSEEYFNQSHELVGLAELYSEEKAGNLRINEILLSISVLALVLISFQQTYYELVLVRRNKELSAAAYLDKLTGIPGRRSCEEALWFPVDMKASSYCVIMMDLNNLKKVNDELGHSTGDKLIKAFAEILYKFNNKKVFVGRYGGDEFLCIVRDYSEEMVQRLLEDIKKRVEEFNRAESKFQIQYASGYEYMGDSLPEMLEKADEKMYENKRRMKAADSGSKS